MTEGALQLGKLPNLRSLVVPDPGHVLVDMDLQRADLWVVAWESGDTALKAKLYAELEDPKNDIHTANAFTIFGAVDYYKRRFAKVFAHGSNYGSKPPKLASELNISRAEASAAQLKWFQGHPGILNWHGRTQHNLYKYRYVANQFGYRRLFFDRPDNCFTDALAWVPASTVALVINHALLQINRALPWVQILLQTHDSLTFQLPTDRLHSAIPLLRHHARVVVPYPEPLTIPVTFSVSTKSWGDVEEYQQPTEESTSCPTPNPLASTTAS